MKSCRIMDRIVGGDCIVLGYGVSNRPLVDCLMSHGAASVTVCDKRTEADMEASGDAAMLAAKGVSLRCGEDYLKGIQGDVIFRSPGIRPDLPEIRAAVDAGAILSSEMELFIALTDAIVIGVTGSDGKTTTTTLISLMLKKQAELDGRGRVYLGGNIGTPLLAQVEEMTAADFAVVELSSFQLMTMTESPRVAVVTNITPNHLNWHVDMAEYIAAKANICTHAPIERVVLNAGDDNTRALGADVKAGVTWFSAYDETWTRDLPRLDARDACVSEKDGVILVGDTPALDVSRIRLPGRHNVENYMTAIAAVSGLVTPEAIAAVADEFTGVEHRLELVREKDGVRYYNGSIDSSPTRTCAALRAMREMNERLGRPDPIVICGGQDKHVPFDPLAEGLCQMAKTVVLTGEARDQIMDALVRCPLYDPEKLPVHVIPDYRTAMRAACEMAESGDTVLLSPACTSFDAFKNFAERGKVFKSIVNAL